MIEFKQIIEDVRKKIDVRTKRMASRELQGCSEPFRCGKGGHECDSCLEDFDIQEARDIIAEAQIQALGYTVQYNPPPIPMRNCDFQFAHTDYDGPGDPRCGCGPDLETCLAKILEIEEEYE